MESDTGEGGGEEERGKDGKRKKKTGAKGRGGERRGGRGKRRGRKIYKIKSFLYYIMV